MRTKLHGERGFVFSLDACLSLLLVMIVVAGVARAGEAGLLYGQHGYLRLQRYANDALETMSLTGSMDNIGDLIISGKIDQAKALARQELRKVLPEEVQFKLVISRENNPDLVIYPSGSANWDDAFKNAGEMAVTAHVLPRRPITRRVLAWLDDPLDEAFMDVVQNGMNWEVTRVSNENYFKDKILKPDNKGGYYYDVIFVPDDNTVQWENYKKNNTWQKLLTFQSRGRLVFGGKTLYTNFYPYDDKYARFMKAFGVDGWGSVLGGSPELVGQPEFNGMIVTDISKEITLPPPFSIGYNVGYSGENYEQYLYYPLSPPKAPQVVANWQNLPENWRINPYPWPGIIWNTDGLSNPTALFNMRLAQSAMDNTTAPPNAGKEDWILLARRAIGIKVSEFKPAILYVWRGGEI